MEITTLQNSFPVGSLGKRHGIDVVNRTEFRVGKGAMASEPPPKVNLEGPRQNERNKN